MKVFFPGPYSPPQQPAWGTPARTCCCGQHLDNAGQVVFPEASCSAPLHPQGTSISGSQQTREKIWRRSAGSCGLVLLCQPSHSAEYMLNSAAGLQPTTYFSSTLNSHQCACKQLPLHQTGCLVRLCRLLGVSPHSYSLCLNYGICWGAVLAVPKEPAPAVPNMKTRDWPATLPGGGLGPLAEQAPTN